MKKIILSNIFLLLFAVNAFAENSVFSDHLALYGQAKYNTDFSNFSYADPKAKKGGSVTLPEYGSFDSFNPFIFKGIAPSSVVGLTIDTLAVVPVDDFSVAYPLIAEKFEISKDGNFVGFIINPKATFYNGTKITADDVVFTFESLVKKGSPFYKIYYADVKEVKKINQHHVRFYFKENTENKELPLIIAQMPVLSKEFFADKDFEKPSLEPMLASGPYYIDSFDQGNFIILKRNKNYWAQNLPTRKGFFNFDEIRYDFYQDTTITKQALFAGNIDLREEYIAKNWKIGYDNPLVTSGKILKKEFTHNKTAPLQSFLFNTRKPMFQNRKVRKAIGYAFDFEWTNKNLFYEQYKRTDSFFKNSGMEAEKLPNAREMKILNKVKHLLPKELFTSPLSVPTHNNAQKSRQNLQTAVKLLKEAGYDFKDGKMVNIQTGEPLVFEILDNSSNGSSFTRIMLPFLNNLKKIGISASFRTVETNIFKNRLDNFDFDMVIISFGMSQMPGNEQKELWGSETADVSGSFNLAGVKNEAVDTIINMLINAKTKNEYEACVAALDRVLQWHHFLIFQWYSPVQRVAFWDKFEYPKSQSLEQNGFTIHTWWKKQ